MSGPAILDAAGDWLMVDEHVRIVGALQFRPEPAHAPIRIVLFAVFWLALTILCAQVPARVLVIASPNLQIHGDSGKNGTDLNAIESRMEQIADAGIAENDPVKLLLERMGRDEEKR